jgi:hypothetical protein
VGLLSGLADTSISLPATNRSLLRYDSGISRWTQASYTPAGTYYYYKRYNVSVNEQINNTVVQGIYFIYPLWGSVNATITMNGFTVSNTDCFLTCNTAGLYNISIFIGSMQDNNISLILLKNGVPIKYVFNKTGNNSLCVDLLNYSLVPTDILSMGWTANNKALFHVSAEISNVF